MTNVLERHHRELLALCRKYRVKRLDAFGSVVRGDFDEHSSDVDLLVQFEDLPHGEHAAIIALRNQLTHAYSAVDHGTVWGILERRMPQLQREVTALLSESENRGSGGTPPHLDD